MSTIPEEARKSLVQFIFHANKSVLHPLDWRRFYVFVIVNHRLGMELTETNVTSLLEEGGFAPENARAISNIYYHGRRLLRQM
jgi:hypothetical protein